MRPFDASGEFAGGAAPGGTALRRLAVRGAGMTVFSSVLSLVIQMAATVVLARILTPKEFGVVAMVTTFSLLFSNFGINGITEAVIQREKLDHGQASNLFWMTLCGGVFLTLSFGAAGTMLAKFYAEPLVASVTHGVALTILFTSISVVHLALLKRAMRFSALAANDIVAKAVSVVTSVALGVAGWGVWALVAGICVLPLSTSIGAIILCRWIPGPPRHAEGTTAMAKYAMFTYGRFGVNYFARNIDNLLVGWRFGAPALGFYKKAYDLFSLSASQLVSSISIVAVAALSRVRNNGALFRKYLLGAIAMTAFLGMWIAGDLTLVGKDLILVLLGPSWEEAGRIFIWFAPGIGAMMLYGTHGWIHLSIGRADRWLRWGIVEWTVTILLFLAALHLGPRGIAAAWCISFWVLTLPAMWFAGAPVGIGARAVAAVAWRYVAAAIAAGAASFLVLESAAGITATAGISAAALRIVIVSSMYSAIYLGAVVVLHRGAAPLRQMAVLVGEMASLRQEEKASV